MLLWVLCHWIHWFSYATEFLKKMSKAVYGTWGLISVSVGIFMLEQKCNNCDQMFPGMFWNNFLLRCFKLQNADVSFNSNSLFHVKWHSYCLECFKETTVFVITAFTAEFDWVSHSHFSPHPVQYVNCAFSKLGQFGAETTEHLVSRTATMQFPSSPCTFFTKSSNK